MGKKKALCGIISELKKAGIPFEIVTIKTDPKTEKEVRDYVMGIEEAHKRAAKSKLIFKTTVPYQNQRSTTQSSAFYLS